jgi:methylglutaconyl-CoA hydratase
MLEELKSGYVKTEKENGVAVIEFYHPQINSLPKEILYALAEAIKHASDDLNTKVIILRSKGDEVFCSGAFFDELASIKNTSQGTQFFMGFAYIINAMRKASQLIIARIQGKCVGGGVGLAAAADYAIAVEGSDIKLSELTIGIGPFVIAPAVERKIGLSAFSQLSINADIWKSAEWAKKEGLYFELHSDIQSMDESISRLSTTLSRYNPKAMKALKNVLWKGTENWDILLKERAILSGSLILSDYSQNYFATKFNKL